MSMRTLKMILGALLLMCGAAALPAWADHGGVRIGVGIGVPLWPWYYPPAYAYPPAYYPPQVVVAQPPVYVQQSETAPVAPAPQTGNWYYCESAKGYYPYVRECPSGWQPVAPQPPASPR
jgi:hypothetical protein